MSFYKSFCLIARSGSGLYQTISTTLPDGTLHRGLRGLGVGQRDVAECLALELSLGQVRELVDTYIMPNIVY